MGDIAYWDHEFQEKLREIHESVGKLRNMEAGADKEKIVNACEKKLQTLSSTTRRTFNMELRQLDREMKQPYQVKLESYDRQVDELKTELKWVKRELESNEDSRALLFGDRAERGEMKGKSENKEFSRDDMLRAAHSVQDQTEASLQRTLQSAQEANEIADATLENLNRQTEQIKKIDEGLTNIQSELDLAQDIMKSFLKRMQTDRILLIFAVLCILGFIVAIIVAKVLPK